MVLSLLLSQDHTTVCAIYSPETMQTKQISDVYLYGSVHVCRLGETTWVPQCPIQTNYHHPSTCQTSFSPLLNWPAGKKKRERRESLVKSNIHLDARSCRIVKYEVNSSLKTSAKKCIFFKYATERSLTIENNNEMRPALWRQVPSGLAAFSNVNQMPVGWCRGFHSPSTMHSKTLAVCVQAEKQVSACTLIMPYAHLPFFIPLFVLLLVFFPLQTF